jgi:hypothetical protein
MNFAMGSQDNLIAITFLARRKLPFRMKEPSSLLIGLPAELVARRRLLKSGLRAPPDGKFPCQKK